MKVKELIEKLQTMNPEAKVVKSIDFEYVEIDTVSEISLWTIEYQEEYGVETVWEDCEPSYEGAFPAVYLGI
jgi:hypothetical protein